MTNHTYNTFFGRFSTAAAVLSIATLAGCKSTPKVIDDTTLANNVHTALTGDSTIANQPIQSTVASGVVTLNGNVSDDTARLVAAEDAAKVTGVKEVVNNLTIQGVQLAPTITSPDAPTAPRVATKAERQVISRHETLPPPPSYNSGSAPAPTQTTAQLPPPPPPPPAPVFRDLSVPAGAGVSVRINQTLDSGTTQEGSTFTGVLVNSITVDGETAIPAGSGVSGRVVNAHDAGHYSGNSLLSIEITSLRRRGENIAVSSEPYTLEGKGRGKNTAEKVGGGAAVGAILGGIFGGGKGAAIGAAAGGGGGAVYNGVTRGQQVQIASETVVRFRLANGFTVRSAGRAEEPADERYNDGYNNGGLQQRPPQ